MFRPTVMSMSKLVRCPQRAARSVRRSGSDGFVEFAARWVPCPSGAASPEHGLDDSRVRAHFIRPDSGAQLLCLLPCCQLVVEPLGVLELEVFGRVLPPGPVLLLAQLRACHSLVVSSCARREGSGVPFSRRFSPPLRGEFACSACARRARSPSILSHRFGLAVRLHLPRPVPALDAASPVARRRPARSVRLFTRRAFRLPSAAPSR